MDFLKKIGFNLICFLLITNVSAQDYKLLQNAFAQSYVFEANKNYVGAIEILLKVSNEKTYESNLRLGWLYYASQNYSESINHYQKACDVMPASIEAKLGIVLPLTALGSWDKVITVYNEILKIDSKYAVVNYKLGLIYYTRENYALAKKYFDVYLNLFPFDFDILNISAWNNFRMGNVEIAKSLFNKALLVYPNNSDCLEGLRQCK